MSLSDLTNLDPDFTSRYFVQHAEAGLSQVPILQRGVEIIELECNDSSSSKDGSESEWETEEEEEVEYDNELASR